LAADAETADGWVIVVDDENRPLGWLSTELLSTLGTTVTASGLVSGGSLYRVDDGSLRSALDSALSSPAGVGIAVDGDGVVVGGIRADAVLEALAQARKTGEVPA
jgi:osmoprotectant transport system ATP-binding protein